MAEECALNPRLRDYGFYRKLDSGELEFISFCSPLAKDMISMTSRDYQELIDNLIPKSKLKR